MELDRIRSVRAGDLKLGDHLSIYGRMAPVVEIRPLAGAGYGAHIAVTCRYRDERRGLVNHTQTFWLGELLGAATPLPGRVIVGLDFTNRKGA